MRLRFHGFFRIQYPAVDHMSSIVWISRITSLIISHIELNLFKFFMLKQIFFWKNQNFLIIRSIHDFEFGKARTISDLKVIFVCVLSQSFLKTFIHLKLWGSKFQYAWNIPDFPKHIREYAQKYRHWHYIQ